MAVFRSVLSCRHGAQVVCGLPQRHDPKPVGEGTESLVAKRRTETPAETKELMEEVVEGENLKEALRRVKANKGSPGVDGMTVQQSRAASVPWLETAGLD